MSAPDRDVALPGQVAEVLGREAVWADAAIEEDAVLAAVLSASAGAAAGPPRAVVSPSGIGGHGAAALAGAAAVLALLAILVLAGVLPLRAAGPSFPDGVLVVLGPPADRPAGASAAMELQDLPDGLRIEVDVQGLPPAPPDTYYEAFLQPSGGKPVSAGSFHLRGGGDRVVLWAGIGVQPDLAVTITAQPAGEVVLSGTTGG